MHGAGRKCLRAVAIIATIVATADATLRLPVAGRTKEGGSWGYIYLRACRTFCAPPKLEAMVVSMQMGRGESREQQRDSGRRDKREGKGGSGGCVRVIYANDAKDALPHLSGHCACL